MKHVKWLICLIIVFLLGTPTVSAADTQRVVLTSFGDALMLTAEEAPAAWELPDLKSGEALSEPGTLILANDTNTTHTITLDYVALPFDNTTALSYLNHLYITVRDGETILYSGAYARINDENGLRLSYDLEAGEQVALSIDLRCDYTLLAGPTGFESDDVIDWKFYTVVETEVEDSEKPAAAFSDPALREVLIAAGAAVVLLVGVGIYELIRRRKQ